MQRLILVMLLALSAVLLAACGPSAPTPSPATATAISLLEVNKTLPGPTSPPDEAGSIPVWIVGRDASTITSVDNGMGTRIPVSTPEPAMFYKLEWTNNTGNDLNGFSGVLLFKGKDGQTIEGFSEAVNKPIKQGETITTTFEMVNNPYMTTRQQMSSVPNSDLSVTFKPKFLTLADGNQIEAP